MDQEYAPPIRPTVVDDVMIESSAWAWRLAILMLVLCDIGEG
jgi:hypothetical protein